MLNHNHYRLRLDLIMKVIKIYWTGEYYYLRGTSLDGYWPDANQYALPLTLYDENGNKIKTYELNKRANKNGFGNML